jgi:multisubunit Na+/H+ antiporter MnhG subunit
MRSRFVTVEVFAPFEALIIISLIYTPAPLISTFGYTNEASTVSLAIGIVLGLIAVCQAIFGLISFRAHLFCASILGIILLALGIFGTFPELPRIMFRVYGVLLVVFSIITETNGTRVKRKPERQVSEQKEQRREIRKAA